MLIFDDNSKPIILDSIHAPTYTTHMWVLNFAMMDFTLAPLLVLEEIQCPSVLVEIRGFRFPLPANWNILIYDKETSQLDVVEISEASGREFTAMVYGPRKASVVAGPITVLDYQYEFTNIAPALNKHQMLCHPIGPDEWVNVAPSDTYNKYLKNLIVGDLIG